MLEHNPVGLAPGRVKAEICIPEFAPTVRSPRLSFPTGGRTLEPAIARVHAGVRLPRAYDTHDNNQSALPIRSELARLDLSDIAHNDSGDDLLDDIDDEHELGVEYWAGEHSTRYMAGGQRDDALDDLLNESRLRAARASGQERDTEPSKLAPWQLSVPPPPPPERPAPSMPERGRHVRQPWAGVPPPPPPPLPQPWLPRGPLPRRRPRRAWRSRRRRRWRRGRCHTAAAGVPPAAAGKERASGDAPVSNAPAAKKVKLESGDKQALPSGVKFPQWLAVEIVVCALPLARSMPLLDGDTEAQCVRVAI